MNCVCNKITFEKMCNVCIYEYLKIFKINIDSDDDSYEGAIVFPPRFDVFKMSDQVKVLDFSNLYDVKSLNSQDMMI